MFRPIALKMETSRLLILVSTITILGISVEASVTCSGTDLTSCDGPPLKDLNAEACPYLQMYVAGHNVDAVAIQHISECSRPVFSTSSQFGTAAAVSARLDVDGPPSQGAFLFLRNGQSWHLVDVLFSPAWTHGGSCETRFQFQWGGQNDKSTARLSTYSERICHQPLDQAELASGESDTASHECQYAEYQIRMTTIKRLSKVEKDGPCPNDK